MKRLLIKYIVCLLMMNFVVPTSAIDRRELVKYADALKGKKKAELKKAIYDICKPKRTLAYGSGEGKTWSGFYKTDRIAGTQECVNRYSDRRFYFSSPNTVIAGMNIEHSFPKSWWGGTSNDAYKDLFNLYPSESDANSKKSNYPMGKVTNPNILNDYEKVGSGPAGTFGNIKLCEPNDKWKGDFCRSYFYMATVYQNFRWEGTQGLQQLENNEWPTLREWAYKLYLEWTRMDKVLDVEVIRNNAIYEIQGNRNLFIDFPYLAEYVWGDSINVEFNPYTSITTASDDDRYLATPVIPDNDDNGGDTGNDGDDNGNDDDDDNGGTNDSDLTTTDYYFIETFNGCEGTGGNDGSWNGSIASSAMKSESSDNTGWSFTSAYEANGCVRFGTGKAVGSATTPSISGLKGKTLTLYFTAAAWDSASEQTTLNISGTNCSLSVSSVTLRKQEWTTYAINVTNITGNVTFTFAGTGGGNRFFIDNFFIPNEEIFDPSKQYICCDKYSHSAIHLKELTYQVGFASEQ